MRKNVFRYFVATNENGVVLEFQGLLDEGYPLEIPPEFLEITEDVLSINVEDLCEEAFSGEGKELMYKDGVLFVNNIYVFNEGKMYE